MYMHVMLPAATTHATTRTAYKRFAALNSTIRADFFLNALKGAIVMARGPVDHRRHSSASILHCLI